MNLFLFRHGDAPFGPIERVLSEKGKDEVLKMAEWLTGVCAHEDIRVTGLFHSGKKRAVQTAEILRPLISPSLDSQFMAQICPGDDPESFIEFLNAAQGNIVVVSHEPFVPRLCERLIGGLPPNYEVSVSRLPFRVKTATCFHFEKSSSGFVLKGMVHPGLLP